ncbi:MAG: metal ABC transporter permease, partial [Chloroflexota bacterium]|nr:metal ABC transporter permease [Chloroflexota bacterium]
MRFDFQMTIILTGVLVAASCALVGSLLVLRKLSVVGDAISHTIVLGIVLAALLTGQISSVPTLVGATLIGLLTVLLIEMLSRTGLVKEDASIGIVFPALFALGVLLLSRYAGNVHLDVEHVLYGEIAYTPFDKLVIGGWDLGARALWVLGSIAVLDLLFVLALYKELKLAAFDPGLAAALGLSPVVLHYLLMAVVSFTTVGAFDAVGAVLVVAFLIVPPSTAYLLTDRLSAMMALSVAVGALSAVMGYWLARALDASIAGSMATSTGLLFALAFAFSPSHGLVTRAVRAVRLRRAFAVELLVAHLRRRERETLAAIEHEFGWGPRRTREVIQEA